MRTAMSVIGFALLFWVTAVIAVGVFVFVVGWPQSDEPAGEAWGLLFLIPLAAGGIYGWRRARTQRPT
jgi:membrane protein DedA with SNARE-associated domain